VNFIAAPPQSNAPRVRQAPEGEPTPWHAALRASLRGVEESVDAHEVGQNAIPGGNP